MAIGCFPCSSYLPQQGLCHIRSRNREHRGPESCSATYVGRVDCHTLVSGMGNQEPLTPRLTSIDFITYYHREATAIEGGFGNHKLVEGSSHSLVAVGRGAVFWFHTLKHSLVRFNHNQHLGGDSRTRWVLRLLGSSLRRFVRRHRNAPEKSRAIGTTARRGDFDGRLGRSIRQSAALPP